MNINTKSNISQTAGTVEVNEAPNTVLEQRIGSIKEQAAAYSEFFPAVEEKRKADAAFEKAKANYKEKFPQGNLVGDSKKIDESMLNIYFDLKDLGAEQFMLNPTYSSFMVDMAQRHAANTEVLKKRPITRETRTELNNRQNEFFVSPVRNITKELLKIAQSNDEQFVNVKQIKAKTISVFTNSQMDAADIKLNMEKLFGNYDGKKTLEELLARDADLSTTIKLLADQGEFDYQMGESKGEKNQHLIGAAGANAEAEAEVGEIDDADFENSAPFDYNTKINF
jgi:hypothetical protein